MTRLAYPVAIVVLVVALGVWYFVFRPTVEVAATERPDVTIVCAPSASMAEDDCRAWGDAVLAMGPPTNTFELEDVVRVKFERAPFSGSCRAEYFLGRYPDEVAWTEDVECPTLD